MGWTSIHLPAILMWFYRGTIGFDTHSIYRKPPAWCNVLSEVWEWQEQSSRGGTWRYFIRKWPGWKYHYFGSLVSYYVILCYYSIWKAFKQVLVFVCCTVLCVGYINFTVAFHHSPVCWEASSFAVIARPIVFIIVPLPTCWSHLFFVSCQPHYSKHQWQQQFMLRKSHFVSCQPHDDMMIL